MATIELKPDKKPKFKHNYNGSLFPEYTGEINTDPSMTVPDMSMSIQEIMQRHVQGRPYPKGNKNLLYTGDVPSPDTRTMDITEIDAMKERNLELIRDQHAEIKNRQELRKKANAEKRAKQKALLEKLGKVEQTEKPV